MKKGGMILLSIGVIAMFGIVGVAMWQQEAGGLVEDTNVLPTPAAVQDPSLNTSSAVREENKIAPVPRAAAASSSESIPTPPAVLNFKTEKILPVGATGVDLAFWIRDVNSDADALMVETTEFFYKSGKTNVYNPEFRKLEDISELTCVGTAELSCVYHVTFVGELGWRDVFSGRIQARDAGGRVSKVIPFHVAIGTQN